MTEYITKEQALYIVSYAANTGNLEKAQKLLDTASTADVAPVVRGKWIESEHDSFIRSMPVEDWVMKDMERKMKIT